MITNVSRFWIVAGAMAIGLLGTPSESRAQARAWHTYSFIDSPAYTRPIYATSVTAYRPIWWQTNRPLLNWWANRPLLNWWANRPLLNRTLFRPVAGTVVDDVSNSCPTQTVSYVPQTTFRTETVDVPVTTYQPVTACDSCGNAVTTYRPVTTMVRQTRRVPVTTYRPVVTYSNPLRTRILSYFAPTNLCCTPAPAPSTVPSATLTPAPSLDSATNQSPYGATPKTFKKVPAEPPQPELKPEADEMPGSNTKSTHGPLRQLPRVIDPQDRTTMLNAAPSVQTVARTTPSDNHTPQVVEVIHWRAAKSR